MPPAARHPRLLVPVVLLLGLTACAQQGPTDEPPSAAATSAGRLPDELVGKTFWVYDVTGRELVTRVPVQIGFAADRVTAYGGCNHLFARAALEGSTLVAGPMGGTEMACAPALMAQDAWLAGFLTSGPTLTVSGDRLTLTKSGTTLSLRTRPEPPVVGTTWRLDSVLTGTGPDAAAVSVAEGAWLRVEDDTLQVSTPCNRGRASVQVEDRSWTLGPLMTTKRACTDPDATRTEAAVLAVLGGTGDRTRVDVERDDGGLVLSRDGVPQQLRFAAPPVRG